MGYRCGKLVWGPKLDCQCARAVERGHCLATASCICCLATVGDLALTNPCSALRAEGANRYCGVVVSRAAQLIGCAMTHFASILRYYQEPLLFPRPFYMRIWYRTVSDCTVDGVCYMFSLCAGVACLASQLVLHVWNVMQSLYVCKCHPATSVACVLACTDVHTHARTHTHAACVHARTHICVNNYRTYHMHANFHRTYISQIQVCEDFQNFILQIPILPEDFTNHVGYHCSYHTAVR